MFVKWNPSSYPAKPDFTEKRFHCPTGDLSRLWGRIQLKKDLPKQVFFCLCGTKKMDLRYWKNEVEPAWFLMKYPTNNRFAEQSYQVSSLFSLLSSLEKVEVKNREKREERIVKSEENKKKKPPSRLFLFGCSEPFRCHFVFWKNK